MQRLFILSLLVLSSRVRAAEPADPYAGPASGLLSGVLFQPSNAAEAQFRAAPAARSEDPDISESRLRVSIVLSTTATDAWTLQQTADQFHLSRSPTIAATGVTIPRDLWSLETGVGYRHKLGDRRDVGFSIGAGSASDEPFHSLHEDILRVSGSYRVPSGERNAWLFSLFYSNNRHFGNNVPIPGVAYIVNDPERGLHAALGLPFLAAFWRPTPDASARFSIFGPRNVSAEGAYRLWRSLQAYAGFDWGERSWLPTSRTDDELRLFYDAKRWSLGARFPLAWGLRGDLGTGYEFGRRMYEDTRARGLGVPDAEFNAAWTFGFKLSARW